MSERVKEKMRNSLAAVSKDPSVNGMTLQARYTNNIIVKTACLCVIVS